MHKADVVDETSEKSDKSFEYTGTSSVGNEKIDINMNINSKYNKKHKEKNDEGLDLSARLEKLNNDIAMLTGTEVYKMIDKLHLSLVVPPIKKTNLIRKNVNFQYAMKLWDFLQAYAKDDTKIVKDKKKYDNDYLLKQMFDDTFLLNYLALMSINKSESQIDDDSQVELVEDLTREKKDNGFHLKKIKDKIKS